MARRSVGLLNPITDHKRGALTDQLVETLREMILDGVFEPGQKLPGSRLMARDARVSRATVLAAIDALSSEGLLEARNRSGTYVAWRDATPSPAKTDHAAGQEADYLPFESCTPPLDLFPLHTWRRLQSRRWWSMPRWALHQSEGPGIAELREAIATNLRVSRGIKCDADEVIVTTGAEMVILLTATAAGAHGARAWIEDPTYARQSAALRAAGVTPVPVPLDGAGLDIQHARRIAPNARLALVTPSSQFPTTVTMTTERREQLLDWAVEHDGLVIEDDYDCEYLPNNAPKALAAMPRGREHVVYLNTFGRTLFPSLRIGYLVAPPSLIGRLREARKLVGGDTTTPNQLVLCDFLTGGHFARHMRHCREAFIARRKTLLEALTTEVGQPLDWVNPVATSHLCLRLPEGTDDVAVAAAAYQAGVLVKPASAWYAGKSASPGLVLGFAPHTPQVIADAVARFAPILRAALNSAP